MGVHFLNITCHPFRLADLITFLRRPDDESECGSKVKTSGVKNSLAVGACVCVCTWLLFVGLNMARDPMVALYFQTINVECEVPLRLYPSFPESHSPL